jgi:hypothetical protein
MQKSVLLKALLPHGSPASSTCWQRRPPPWALQKSVLPSAPFPQGSSLAPSTCLQQRPPPWALQKPVLSRALLPHGLSVAPTTCLHVFLLLEESPTVAFGKLERRRRFIARDDLKSHNALITF